MHQGHAPAKIALNFMDRLPTAFITCNRTEKKINLKKLIRLYTLHA